MDVLLIYSAVTMTLMVACTAAVSVWTMGAMNKQAATAHILARRRRRRPSSAQQEVTQRGSPYRIPGKCDDGGQTLEMLTSVAARFSPLPRSSHSISFTAGALLDWLKGCLIQVAIAAVVIGLVLPLFQGVEMRGGWPTVIALALLYGVCAFVGGLLHAGCLWVALKAELIRNKAGLIAFMGLWLLALAAIPGMALKVVDLASTSFNMSGWSATFLGSVIMWVAHFKSDSKSKAE